MMKKWQWLARLLAAILLLWSGLFSAFTHSGMHIEAAAINGVISEPSVSDAQGNPLTWEVDQWTAIRLNMKLKLPNLTVRAGDTTVITLGDNLSLHSEDDFNVMHQNQIVAVARFNREQNTVTLTYTDYPTHNSDVTGDLYFYARVNPSKVTERGPVPIVATVAGERITYGTVVYQGPPQKVAEPLTKSGWVDDQDPQKLVYYIAVNRGGEAMSNISLSDSLTTPKLTYQTEGWYITKGQWVWANNTWELDNEQEITNQVAVRYNADKTSFNLALPDISANEGYKIIYPVTVGYTPVNGEIYVNQASLTRNGMSPETSEARVAYVKAGGQAEGRTFTINIDKVDDAGAPVSGATFDVVREANGAVMGQITSGLDGSGNISGLLRDHYILREVGVPNGYRQAADTRVDADDFVGTEVTKRIVNSRAVTATDIQLRARKELTGRRAIPGEFTFEVIDSATQMVVAAGTNNDTDDVVFSKMSYTAVGEHTYTIVEKKGTVLGVTYDETAYPVTVSVTDPQNNGTLVATATYPNNAPPVFRNQYTPTPATVSLTATKQLTGKQPAAGQFSFEVVTKDTEEVVARGTNDASGAVQFEPITLTKPGDYFYIIREINDGQSGVQYDNNQYEVEVSVVDNGMAQLTAILYYPAGTAPVFQNTYVAKDAAVALQATKNLSGKALEADQFAFEVVREQDNTVVATGQNNATGTVLFTPFTVGSLGDTHYIIRERDDAQAGVTYDKRQVRVTVSVSDPGTGQKVAAVAYEGGVPPTFTNEYRPMATTATINAKKVLTGKALAANEFTFELVDNQTNQVVRTAQNTATGEVVFEPLNFATAGTRTYTVQEQAGSAGGVTYDNQKHQVTVSVTDNGAGQLQAAVQYAQGVAPTFTNSYVAQPVSVVLTAQKELSGRPLTDALFQFEATAADRTTVVATGSNDANGRIVFTPITLTQEGVYRYTITEQLGTEKGVTYDRTQYEVVVQVTDNGMGQLQATVTYAGNTLPTFRNVYTPERPTPSDPVVPPTGGDTDGYQHNRGGHDRNSAEHNKQQAHHVTITDSQGTRHTGSDRLPETGAAPMAWAWISGFILVVVSAAIWFCNRQLRKTS